MIGDAQSRPRAVAVVALLAANERASDCRPLATARNHRRAAAVQVRRQCAHARARPSTKRVSVLPSASP